MSATVSDLRWRGRSPLRRALEPRGYIDRLYFRFSSLAALELFVHVDIDIAPTRLIAIAADIPEDLETETVDAGKLPKNWRTYPAPEALKNLGTAWAARRTTAILKVPSAVIPEEHNNLLNPRHPNFSQIRVHEPIPFRFVTTVEMTVARTIRNRISRR